MPVVAGTVPIKASATVFVLAIKAFLEEGRHGGV